MTQALLGLAAVFLAVLVGSGLQMLRDMPGWFKREHRGLLIAEYVMFSAVAFIGTMQIAILTNDIYATIGAIIGYILGAICIWRCS